MKEFPEFATFCGFHKYDDRLNDHSVAAFQQKQVCKYMHGMYTHACTHAHTQLQAHMQACTTHKHVHANLPHRQAWHIMMVKQSPDVATIYVID